MRLGSLLRSAAGVALAASAAIGCGPPESTYFPTSGSTAVSVPTDTARDAYFGVELLNATGDDTVVLDSAEFVGGLGQLEAIVSSLGSSKTWIGAGTAPDIESSGVRLADYQPLAGFTFRRSESPVALAIRVSGQGDVAGFEKVRLTFRVNGGAAQHETFDVRGLRCVAATIDAAADACHKALNLPSP